MERYIIVSNNPELAALGQCGELDPRFSVRVVDPNIDAVYNTLEEMLQNHHRLITAPLPPNIPLIRSPVRSVIVRETPGKKYDAEGLLLLENARERTSVLGIVDEDRNRSDRQVIDKDQMLRAIRQIDEIKAAEAAERDGE